MIKTGRSSFGILEVLYMSYHLIIESAIQLPSTVYSILVLQMQPLTLDNLPPFAWMLDRGSVAHRLIPHQATGRLASSCWIPLHV
jgi:hypothetical protein